MSDLLEPALPHTGELLAGRYRLVERIGAGGMGRVYRAHDEILARDVAVKLFYTDTASGADALRKVAEAKVLASLNHPSLVTLYDAQVQAGDHAFLVMELVAGPTLRHRIDAGPLDASEIAGLLGDLAAALAVVHAAGVVHRDVKPSNVLLRPARDGGSQAVLADFGVAHLIDATRLTSPGTVIGTAAYLAPEQVRGEPTVPASDIYALGLMTLEALTRLHPFGLDSVQATVLARLARQPEIPGSLGYRWKSLLTAMTALDPAARPTAEEVAERAGALGPTGAFGGSLRRDARRSGTTPDPTVAGGTAASGEAEAMAAGAALALTQPDLAALTRPEFDVAGAQTRMPGLEVTPAAPAETAGEDAVATSPSHAQPASAAAGARRRVRRRRGRPLLAAGVAAAVLAAGIVAAQGLLPVDGPAIGVPPATTPAPTSPVEVAEEAPAPVSDEQSASETIDTSPVITPVDQPSGDTGDPPAADEVASEQGTGGGAAPGGGGPGAGPGTGDSGPGSGNGGPGPGNGNGNGGAGPESGPGAGPSGGAGAGPGNGGAGGPGSGNGPGGRR